MDTKEEKMQQLKSFLTDIKAYNGRSKNDRNIESTYEKTPISVGYGKKDKESNSFMGKLWSFFPQTQKQEKYS